MTFDDMNLTRILMTFDDIWLFFMTYHLDVIKCHEIYFNLTLNVPEIHPMTYGQGQEYEHHNPRNAQSFN